MENCFRDFFVGGDEMKNRLTKFVEKHEVAANTGLNGAGIALIYFGLKAAEAGKLIEGAVFVALGLAAIALKYKARL